MVACDEKMASRRTSGVAGGHLFSHSRFGDVACNARSASDCPSLGTWTSQDPAQYINGANTYQLVGSSPVGNVDASGLQVDSPWGGQVPSQELAEVTKIHLEEHQASVKADAEVDQKIYQGVSHALEVIKNRLLDWGDALYHIWKTVREKDRDIEPPCEE